MQIYGGEKHPETIQRVTRPLKIRPVKPPTQSTSIIGVFGRPANSLVNDSQVTIVNIWETKRKIQHDYFWYAVMSVPVHDPLKFTVGTAWNSIIPSWSHNAWVFFLPKRPQMDTAPKSPKTRTSFKLITGFAIRRYNALLSCCCCCKSVVPPQSLLLITATFSPFLIFSCLFSAFLCRLNTSSRYMFFFFSPSSCSGQGAKSSPSSCQRWWRPTC